MGTPRPGLDRQRVRRAATIAAPVGLGVCLVVSPQLLGGAYGWGMAIIAGLSAIACLLAVWAARADGSRPALDLPAAALLAACVWTGVQAAPLPRAVTQMVQPTAVEMADTAAELVGESPPSWIALSISPGSTRAEIVKGLAFLATFFAAWLLVSLGHRRGVAQLVALSALAMALVALGHFAAAAERVFGLYEQIFTGSALLAPLLNGNHLSGFLAMGTPVLIGLGLDEEDRGRRIGYLVGAVVVGAAALLAISRGGVAALACGVLVLAALGLARRRRGERRNLGIAYATLGATAATAAGLGLYVGAEAIYHDFEASDTSKLELGLQGLALGIDHPWVGVGRGAFSAAFVSQHGQDVRFTHPENLLAQWTSEWGLVFAVALFAILAWAVIRAVAASTSWTHLGATAGIVSIAVHDLVDFALEMSGVAVVAAALLATVIAPRRSSRSKKRKEDEPRAIRASHAATLSGIAALAAVALIGWRIDGESVFGLQTRLGELSGGESRTVFRGALVDAIRLHPAEPAFPLLGGAEAVRRGDPRAVAWLNRAMVLAPGWASPHVETAYYLSREGRLAQAFLEVGEAEERQPGAATALACAILHRRPERAAELARIAGDGIAGDEEAGAAFLDRVARCLPVEHPATVALDDALAGREHGVGAHLRHAHRALLAGEPEAALRVLEPVRGTREAEVHLVRARSMMQLGWHASAIRVLGRAERFADRPEAILRLRAEAEVQAGDAEAMRLTMEKLRGRAAGRARTLADGWLFQGQLERALRNDGHAMQAFERANRLDPSSSALAAVASLAEQTGELGRAMRANGELCRRSGPESASCAAEERLRRRIVEPPPYVVQPLGTP